MTVSSTDLKCQYWGDGVTVAFPITFQFQNASDLVLTILSVDGITETTPPPASVTGGNGSTGTMNLTTAPTGNGTSTGSQRVTISRNIPLNQQIELSPNDPFPAKTVERGLGDRFIMLLQQVQERLNRGISLRVSSSHAPIIIVEDPIPGRLPTFDANGNIINGPTVADIENAAQIVADAAGYADNAAIHDMSALQAAVDADVSSEASSTRWLFNSATATADPGTGLMSLNNAALASVTAINVSAVTSNRGAPNLRLQIAAWDDSSSSIRGTLKMQSKLNPATFAIYNIIGNTVDNTGWLTLSVAYVIGNGVFSAGDSVNVFVSRTGDNGTLSSAYISAQLAVAFGVGRTVGDPLIAYDTSDAAGVTGWVMKATPAGSNPTLTVRSPNANEGGTIGAKGTAALATSSSLNVNGNLSVNNGATLLSMTQFQTQIISNSRQSNLPGFAYVPFQTGNFTASTETPVMLLGMGSTNTYNAGAKGFQRDILATGTTNAASGATTIGVAATLGISPPIAGTNVTQTVSCGIYVGSSNVGAGTVNGFAAVLNAPTGAGTGNFGLSVLGGKSLFDAATAGYASINLASSAGVDPSSPVNGDIWYNGTDIKARVGGVTKSLGGWTSGTPTASTSGTSINYTGIPANVKKIVASFNGVTTSGSSGVGIKIGDGAIVSTGYAESICGYNTAGTTTLTSPTTFFALTQSYSGSIRGDIELTLHDPANNIWAAKGIAASPIMFVMAGDLDLVGVLDRLSFVTANGTDTFTGGSVNITYQ